MGFGGRNAIVQRGSLKAKLKDGVKVWRAQWRENGRGRTRILGRCAELSRAEARAELDRILAPLNSRPIAPCPNMTLRQYVEDEYLTVKTRVWKASTRATTEQIITTHILSELGAQPLALITRKQLPGRESGGGSLRIRCWTCSLATRRYLQHGDG